MPLRSFRAKCSGGRWEEIGGDVDGHAQQGQGGEAVRRLGQVRHSREGGGHVEHAIVADSDDGRATKVGPPDPAGEAARRAVLSAGLLDRFQVEGALCGP